MKIAQLSDEDLLASTKRYAARERETTAALESALAEVDARYPGMRQGWPRRVDDCSDVAQGGPIPRRRRGSRA
jgi:3',5'-cyclic AMP phosphodiesterase CpdA